MRITSLISKILNVKGMVIKSIRVEPYEDGEEGIIIDAEPTKRNKCRCGICNRKSQGYDEGRGVRLWRSVDLGSMRVFIRGRAPRVRCERHGVVVAKVPWARHASWFTREFEDMMTWLSLHCTRSVVSELMRVQWNTVGPVVSRVYDEIKDSIDSPFDNLRQIGIDETSYKKGHKYITVVVNHETGDLVWAGKGYGKEVLEGFFKQMTEAQCANITHVSADGARWIADCVAAHCPNAVRCIDPFHVVSWATEALDEVRRGVWNDARNSEKAPKDNKNEKDADKGKSKPIKNSRYALLKNPENLTAGQEANIEMIATSNPMLYRAYRLKEFLRLTLKLPEPEATEAIDKWMKWAQRCRIPQFMELRKKIKRHRDAIMQTIRARITNARVEALNNEIKVTIRMGYGFRNIDNMISLLMLRCSGVKVGLPGRG